MKNVTLEKLKQLMPPPILPIGRPEGMDWERLEQQLGICFPEDYKELIADYGSGYIFEYFMVCFPCGGKKINCLEFFSSQTLLSEKMLQSEEPELYEPFRFWPENGGLFPFAQSAGSIFLYWETKGDPSQWRIVVQGGVDFEIFDGSFTHLILDWKLGVQKSEIIPQKVFGYGFLPTVFADVRKPAI